MSYLNLSELSTCPRGPAPRICTTINMARYSECGEKYATLDQAYPSGLRNAMCDSRCAIPTNYTTCTQPGYSSSWNGWGQGSNGSNGYSGRSNGYNGNGYNNGNNSSNSVRSCGADGRVRCDRIGRY